VHLAVGDVDEAWDVAAQVQQRMQLERSLGATGRRPREEREAQIDGRGIQRMGRVRELDAEIVLDIEPARDLDQGLGEIGVDAPVAYFVGIGQRLARDRTADAHVVELVALRTQTGLDIAQALAVGELCEGHAQKLVEAAERLDLVLARVALHTAAEGVQWHLLDDDLG
jgi:hypothetical protein